MIYSEVAARNDSFVAAIKNLKAALIEAEKFPEYPEHNFLIQEITELQDGMATRMLSHLKTTDKGIETRIHQMNLIMNSYMVNS